MFFASDGTQREFAHKLNFIIIHRYYTKVYLLEYLKIVKGNKYHVMFLEINGNKRGRNASILDKIQKRSKLNNPNRSRM